MSIWVDVNGWPVPPVILLGCLAAEIVYFRGWRILVNAEQRKAVRTASSGKGTGSATGPFQWDSWFWRSIYFLAALVALLLASSAPIDILSAQLFWVHMVQHLLFLVVVAPLLVAAAPFLPLWLGLPRWARKVVKILRVGRAFYVLGSWLRQPVITCVIFLVGIWVWHWPTLYNLALNDAVIHDWGEHLTFLAVSMLFWTQVIPSQPLRPRLGYIGRMGCVGFAIAQNVVLAVLIGFAPEPLYAYANLVHGMGGLSALQDQQFGAGIMWTVGDLPFGLAISILLQRWFVFQFGEDEYPHKVVTQHTEVTVGEEQRA